MPYRNSINEEECDDIALEVIRFLKKWGMWSGIKIFTNGKRYEDTLDRNAIAMGESNVKVTSNVTSPEYLAEMSGHGRNKGVCFEHVFDLMMGKSPLYRLLMFEEYDAKTTPHNMAVKIKAAFLDIFERHDLWFYYGYDKSLCTYPARLPKKLLPWWKRLDEVRFKDLDKMSLDIPGGLILYRDEPYILLDIEKHKEYAKRCKTGDIEDGIYESGLNMKIKLIKCGSGESKELSIFDSYSRRSCLDVFDENKIKIPDKKTRREVSRLYRISLGL